MADTLPSVLALDLVDRLRTALDPIGVFYGPPENAPAEVTCWIRYGPVDFEWGLGDVPHPTMQIVVGLPRGGDYPDEYALVNDTAHLVVQALRVPRPTEGNTVALAGEAPIAGVSISEPSEVTYAGAPIMAATVTISIENKENAFL